MSGLAIREGLRIDHLLLVFERFGASNRWPTPKWRRHRRADWELPIKVRCAADVDAAIRLAERHEWMLGESVVTLEADGNHLCVEGMTRRITILFIADKNRVDPWTHDHLRRRIREFSIGRTQ